MTRVKESQDIVDKYYNGDEAAYNEALTRQNASVIDWSDIETQTKCAPDQEYHALAYIQNFLGYIPEPNIYMPHIAFVQVLVDSMEKNLITWDHFIDELVFHAKRIRNDDMLKGEWVRHKTYDESYRKHYENFLPLYKLPARDRLSKLLGYEPLIEYSLEAELFLRRLFQLDSFHSEMPYGDTDLKAATIVRYREAYLLQGKSVADDSDLIGMIYQERKSSN